MMENLGKFNFSRSLMCLLFYRDHQTRYSTKQWKEVQLRKCFEVGQKLEGKEEGPD
jgi:hypothetical protein